MPAHAPPLSARAAFSSSPACASSSRAARAVRRCSRWVTARRAHVVLTAGKDPLEFILAESFVIEQGLSPRTHVPGTRVLLPNWLGRRLTEIGAARGPRVEMRLEGSAITVAANKWRRCDLLAALNGMPKD